MADFTAKDVQALRQATGAGMLDCKRALEETDGDIEKAKQWLREQGLAGAAKRSDREDTQGAVALAVAGRRRRHRRAAVRDRLRRQGRDLRQPHRRAGPAGGREGRAGHGRAHRRHRRPEDHTEGEHLGGPGRPLRDRARTRCSARTSTCSRAGASTPCWSRCAAAATSWPTTSPCTSPSPGRLYLRREDVPAGRGRRRAGHGREPISRNEGKPEAALPKIVEGRMNGWFKERVPARAALRQGREAHDRRARSASAEIVRFAQVVVGG